MRAFSPRAYRRLRRGDLESATRVHAQGGYPTVPAREWVIDLKTKKDLAYPWVFAGSYFIDDAENKEALPQFAANGGDYIGLAVSSSFTDSLIDLKLSEEDLKSLEFGFNTSRIPPQDTPVFLILEPILDRKDTGVGPAPK